MLLLLLLLLLVLVLVLVLVLLREALRSVRRHCSRRAARHERHPVTCRAARHEQREHACMARGGVTGDSRPTQERRRSLSSAPKRRRRSSQAQREARASGRASRAAGDRMHGHPAASKGTYTIYMHIYVRGRAAGAALGMIHGSKAL